MYQCVVAARHQLWPKHNGTVAEETRIHPALRSRAVYVVLQPLRPYGGFGGQILFKVPPGESAKLVYKRLATHSRWKFPLSSSFLSSAGETSSRFAMPRLF